MIRFGAVAAAMALGAAALAGQQGEGGPTTDFTPRGVTLRAGVAFPFDSDLREDEPSSLAFGMDVELEFRLIPSGYGFFSLDTILSDDQLWMAAYNQRLYGSRGLLRDRGVGYFFLGVGLVSAGDQIDRASLLIRGGIGTEIGENLNVELGAWLARETNDVNPSGLSISVGYRFP